MNSADMASLIPNHDDLLALPLEEQGRLILTLLASNDSPGAAVAHSNFFNRANDYAAPPKYGSRQKDVDEALMEAWTWLESRGFLTRKPSSGGAHWYFVGKAGKDFLNGNVGRSPAKQNTEPGNLTLIAESRLVELHALSPAQFDFKKLIRLCEEINTAYSTGCYFATAMLTRGLLDHVPPLFNKSTFNEVANNYSGGGKSFRDAMQHLENAARKVADAHLHMPIRKSETLPTAQQVNSAVQLDLLLSEIVRITK